MPLSGRQNCDRKNTNAHIVHEDIVDIMKGASRTRRSACRIVWYLHGYVAEKRIYHHSVLTTLRLPRGRVDGGSRMCYAVRADSGCISGN